MPVRRITMPTASTGEIHPEVLYTLDELMDRVGLRKAGLREARRHGLRVKYAHRRGYVLGRDWIQYIDERGSESR